MLAGEFLGPLVAHQQDEVPVGIDERSRSLQFGFRREVDRLWKLDDLPVGETLEHVFTKALMAYPDVAEIPPPLNEDGTLRYCCDEVLGIESPGDATHMMAFAHETRIAHLPQPDR